MWTTWLSFSSLENTFVSTGGSSDISVGRGMWRKTWSFLLSDNIDCVSLFNGIFSFLLFFDFVLKENHLEIFKTASPPMKDYVDEEEEEEEEDYEWDYLGKW